VSATDYAPFGAPLPGRSWQNIEYRFGFQGQEKDDEISVAGSSIAYEDRIYNSRLGRWFSLDCMSKKYPNESNYIMTSDNPIFYVDIKGKDKIVSYTVMTDKGTAKFDVVTKNEVMFTYVEKSDRMGNGGAGYPTFTDINQTVVLDFRTNIKPNENKTNYSEEYSGKELGLVEGGKQKVNSVLGKTDKFITGPGGTQGGGIMFTAGDGGASSAKQKSKSTPEIINIETLLIYAGATHFGNTSLPNIKEGIGIAEFIDKLKSAQEAKKELDKPKEGCPNCGADHSKEE
jgi:RHS repeat-associated protein